MFKKNYILDVPINHKLLSKLTFQNFMGGHFGYENTHVGKGGQPRIVPTSSDLPTRRNRKLAFGMSDKSDIS